LGGNFCFYLEQTQRMKKILTSASLAALGVASLHAAYAPGMTSAQTSKPWSVSATLRGFYDDNYTTSPSFRKRESYGFEVSPSAGLNLFMDQTTLGLNYTYDMRFYEDRRNNRADHSHQINAKLSHAFTPRYKLDLSDSFVIAQEPEVLTPIGGVILPLRSEGNNMRNSGNITFSAGLTEKLDAVFGYNNNWYDYEQKGVGSRSALLDRYEHLGMANLRWTIVPSTVGVVGYQYGYTDYTYPGLVAPGIASRVRNTESHYGYLGVDHTFNHQLNASARVGAQYTQYPNRLPGMRKDDVSPYADGNVTYTYTQNSYVQLGVRETRGATDVGLTLGTASVTTDAENTIVYGSLSHQIYGGLQLNFVGQYQHSEFSGGLANNLTDDYWLAGVNLTYEINKFLGVEAGYNYDRLDSDLERLAISRSFTRNRIYVGIRANY